MGLFQDISNGIGNFLKSKIAPTQAPTQGSQVIKTVAPSFDQQMAAKGWTKQPDGSYFQGDTPDITSPSIKQPIVTPPSIPQPSGANPGNIQWLEEKVLPITRKAGLPDALPAGQWAIEGRKKDSSMFNLMFNGQVHTYENTENNVNDYVRTVTNILKNKGYDISKMTDPKQILTALQEGKTRFEGHSKDPMDYVKISSDTPEYKHYLNKGQ